MRKIQRRTALLLAVFLALSSVLFAGCSAAPTPTNTSPTVQSTTSGAATETTVAPIEEPPVTLTMWAMAFEKSFPAGVQDDPVAKEITEKTGVILDITPMNAVSNYSDKLAAALASSDLPDITYIQDMALLPKIISAKAALAFDDYLDVYGQHILTETPYRVEYARKHLSKDVDGNSDGKMYVWTTVGDVDVDPLQVQIAPYLRYDLWEKLGFPKLESMDDYIPVLKQMMEMEPTNKDGKNVYGVSGWFADAPGWNNWVFSAVFGMMQGASTFGTHEYIEMGTNKIGSKILDPDSFYWDGVSWFNKAYLAGIMDPDAPTMKWDNFLEKVSANRVLLGWAPWCMDGGNQSFVQDETPDKGYVQMPNPYKLDRYMVSFAQPQGGNMMFISRKTKHPEKAVAFLDFLTSYEGSKLIFNGVKGVHWDDAGGQPAINPDTLAGLNNDPDYRIKTGIYKYHNIAGRNKSAIDPTYNTPLYFAYLPDIVATRMTDLQKKAANHFGVQLPGDLYMKNPDLKYTEMDTSLTATFPTLPDDIKEIETKINNYIGPAEIQVMLSKSEEEFNKGKAKMIADVKALGAEKALQWYIDEFKKLHPDK